MEGYREPAGREESEPDVLPPDSNAEEEDEKKAKALKAKLDWANRLMDMF